MLLGARRTALAPGELIDAIVIPHAGPSSYVWQRVRPANDISQVGVAVACVGDPATWRVALGGVMPVPLRLPSVEAILGASVPDRASLSAAGREAAERAPFVSDKRATEAYRRHLVAALVRRGVEETVGLAREALRP